jgi:ribosomal protein L11 methyltransferase
MFRLTLTIHPDQEEEILTGLHGTPLSGIAQENRDDGLMTLSVWFVNEADALRASAGLRGARVEEQPDQNWNAGWQSTWQPALVGERWYLVPPGDSSTPPPGRLRLEMCPGLAFGNGDHPTTHLCLKAMETSLVSGDTFLDVGCGSGLLGAAAHLLGARPFGCDLNPTDLPDDSFIGSVNAVKDQCIDVAAMNIQAGTLIELWPELNRVVRRQAILSGFLPEQAAMVREVIEPPWRVVRAEEENGWCALIVTTR